MDYLGRSGIYHRLTPLPHRQGFVQCVECNDDMSTATVETIIRTCKEDMRYRLIRGEAQITSMLDLYYGKGSSPRVYNLYDLQYFMQNASEESQKYLNQFGDLSVIEFIEDDIFRAIDLDPNTLQYADQTISGDGYFVGFISKHASQGFFIQLNNIRRCSNIIEKRLNDGSYHDYSTRYTYRA